MTKKPLPRGRERTRKLRAGEEVFRGRGAKGVHRLHTVPHEGVRQGETEEFGRNGYRQGSFSSCTGDGIGRDTHGCRGWVRRNPEWNGSGEDKKGKRTGTEKKAETKAETGVETGNVWGERDKKW